jgi:hypothetical protein
MSKTVKAGKKENDLRKEKQESDKLKRKPKMKPFSKKDRI